MKKTFLDSLIFGFPLFNFQIAVKANHQQGRDTHLRQIKIFSPVESKPVSTSQVANWSSKDFLQFASIR